ncbi:MAG: YchJ family protein [bacterium]
MSNPCHCGSTLPFSQCCEPALTGEQPALTAEALMRSRYTAYVLENWRYLYKTWHPQTRPTRKELARTSSTHWEKLEVVNTEAGTASDSSGQVEFIATFIEAGAVHQLHETSRFEKLGGAWVYVDGQINTP